MKFWLQQPIIVSSVAPITPKPKSRLFLVTDQYLNVGHFVICVGREDVKTFYCHSSVYMVTIYIFWQ